MGDSAGSWEGVWRIAKSTQIFGLRAVSLRQRAVMSLGFVVQMLFACAVHLTTCWPRLPIEFKQAELLAGYQVLLHSSLLLSKAEQCAHP